MDLRLHASNAGGMGSILVREVLGHVAQSKIFKKKLPA